jgi:hypothetical protein
MSWVWQPLPAAATDPNGPISGALNATEADDTVAGVATLLIKGTLSQTEAADTVVATGGLPIAATLARTEAGDTVTSTGVLSLTAAAAVIEANDTTAATGGILIQGALSVVEANDTVAATASAPIQARLSITEDDDTVVSSFWPVLQVRPRGGPWPVHDDEPAWSRRDWERDLRRIIDEAWRIANGEIDPVTRAELPPPDLSAIHDALSLLADRRARQRIKAVIADHESRAEDEAVALLLLAA